MIILVALQMSLINVSIIQCLSILAYISQLIYHQQNIPQLGKPFM